MQTIIGNLVDTPIGTEIFLGITTLFVFTLVLWLTSKVLKFKKKDFLTALIVSLISAGIPFLIRLNGVILLKYPQTTITNLTAMTIEPILLFILVKIIYSDKWLKSILISIIAYVLKWMIIGFLTVIIIFLFTDIPQQYEEKQKWKDISLAQSIVDFKISVPTYIPEGYQLMSIKPGISEEGEYSNDFVVVSYGKGGSVVSLHQRLRQYPVDYTNDYSKGGEPIIINGNQGVYLEHGGGHNQPYLSWYNKDTKIGFSVFDSIGNELSKEDLIKIAESIK